ncbi:hypothetical protein HK405_013601 [Cladochytrium tenue]|nr:hypothetical protein HK405_013601 [Cladochytrium tenue]
MSHPTPSADAAAATVANHSSSSSDAITVNTTAAAAWSAPAHNSLVADRDRDRFYGAADAFDESLYVFPADADEKARLHMQHIAIRSIFGGNFHTPQQELFLDEKAGAKILDAGCGAGSWTIDMAKQFPHASVTGIVRLSNWIQSKSARTWSRTSG